MPESLTDAQKQLATEAAAFADEVMLPLADSTRTSPDAARNEIRTQSKARGYYAMTQPEEFGGTAASQTDLSLVREAIASRNPPYMDAIFGSSPGVLGGVTGELQSSHLAPLLAGEKAQQFWFHRTG